MQRQIRKWRCRAVPEGGGDVMQQTRSYRNDEVPALGDVVQLCGGPYGAAVVTKVSCPADGKVDDDDRVTCERIHASVGATNQIQIGVERVEVTVGNLRTVPVFVTGASGRIDNRARVV